MKRGKKIIIIFSALAFLCSLSFSNGLNLDGLGSRAISMGGAFVGLADDYSAIYWNPAGAAFFSSKVFGVSGLDILPSSTYEMSIPVPGVGPLTIVDAKTTTKHYLAGMAAYYHPVSPNIVAGIGVYTPSGLGANWDGQDFAVISGNNPAIKWQSKVGVVSFSPLIAVKLSDQIAFGATFNLNYGMFDLAMHAGEVIIPIAVLPYYMYVDLGQYEESMTGWGYGATFGFMFKPNEVFSLGASLKTPSTIKFKGEASISNLSLIGANATSDSERDVTWPLWIGAGIAFNPTPGLTLTADIQWTQWSTLDNIRTDYKDPFWQIMMEESGDDNRPLRWKNVAQLRFGFEYLMRENLALRGGYCYDPTPTPDETLNVLLPSYTFNVFDIGLGYNLNGLCIDFGLEYLAGKEREVLYEKYVLDPDYATAQPGIYNISIFVPHFAISYKF
ncbi:MAG: OmpP1/FadL family transporter [Acidobacteriota bacterium]